MNTIGVRDVGKPSRGLRVTRRVVLLCVALVVSVLLVGGTMQASSGVLHPLAPNSDAASLTGTPRAPAGAPPTGGATYGGAHAEIFAKTVNLRQADIPGFGAISGGERETAGEKQLEREALDCIGAHPPGGTPAEEGSQRFTNDGSAQQEVRSEVNVAPTASWATKEVAMFASPHGRDCLSRFFARTLRSALRPIIGPVSATPLSLSPAAPRESFGWRLGSTITASGVRTPVYLDILGFAFGRSEVALFSSCVDHPLSAATEQRLFTLLVRRAEAHRT